MIRGRAIRFTGSDVPIVEGSLMRISPISAGYVQPMWASVRSISCISDRLEPPHTYMDEGSDHDITHGTARRHQHIGPALPARMARAVLRQAHREGGGQASLVHAAEGPGPGRAHRHP